MIATCTKCRGLYTADETKPLEPVHLCPRCVAFAELLEASTALLARLLTMTWRAPQAQALFLPQLNRLGSAVSAAKAAQQ